MRKSMAATKAKEKAMKEVKEAERLVCCHSCSPYLLYTVDLCELGFAWEVLGLNSCWYDSASLAKSTGYQGPTSSQGGKGSIWEDSRDDAQEEGGAVEEEGEEEQDVEILGSSLGEQ